MIYTMDVMDFLSTIPPESADLIIADPPYFEILKESWDRQWKSYREFIDWNMAWIQQAANSLKEGGSLYIWGTMKNTSIFALKVLIETQIPELRHELEIVWSYDLGGRRRDHFGYKHQYAIVLTKARNSATRPVFYREAVEIERSVKINPNTGETIDRGKIPTCVWTVNMHTMSKERETSTWHPSPKPFSVLRRIIEAHTVKGDLVFDLFSGSRSTYIVATNLGRECLGCDFEQKYEQPGKDRIEFWKGQPMPKLFS